MKEEISDKATIRLYTDFISQLEDDKTPKSARFTALIEHYLKGKQNG